MKKKWLIGLMALCMSCATVAFVGCGESGNEDNTGGGEYTEQGVGVSPPVIAEGLEYELSEDGAYYIVTGIGTCTNTDISIPSTYEGIPVKKIDGLAFSDCYNLTNVTIDDNVMTIGRGAFKDCNSLTKIVIPDSVTTIGEEAFCGCKSLTNIKVSINNANYKDIDGNLYTKDGKTLVQYAIGKTATSFTIPDSVTTIGDYAFSDCYNLTNVTIDDNATTIGWGAFEGCVSLTSVVIGDSVTTIGYSAFRGCGLTEIVIPDSVTTIRDYAFSSCRSLTNIIVSTNNTRYESIGGNLYTKDGKILVQYAIGKTATSFTIPDSVTEIGYDAFAYCTSLTSVAIGDGVTTIGDWAFSGCDDLTSVVMGDGVTTIGDWAFVNCNSLKRIVIPNSVITIGWSAFEGCDSLTSVIIGDSVTTIESCAFKDCSSLTSIKFNGTVREWNKIKKGSYWNSNVLATKVVCVGGEVEI